MKIKTLLLWFGIILTASLTASAQEDSALVEQDCPLLTAEEAIKRALEYTGFDGLRGFMDNLRCAATLGPVKDSRTPFVAEYMKNNKVWKLDFIDVELAGRFGKVNRDFEIILDAFTGQLLSVFSISDELGSSDTLPEPSAEIAEQYMTRKRLLFYSFPTETPKVSLIEAFGKCHLNPYTAKKIRALYTGFHTRTTMHGGSWIIILRGTEVPFEAFGSWGFVPVNERNCMLFSINAESGFFEFGMTAPQDIDYIRRMKGITK